VKLRPRTSGRVFSNYDQNDEVDDHKQELEKVKLSVKTDGRVEV
jgi:hypothetical protein